MSPLLLLGQAAAPEGQGWLTTKLLSVTLSSAEWVLWLLLILSVLSIAAILERAVYFSTHSLKDADGVVAALGRGDLESVRKAVAGQKGMEAAMLQNALASLSQGPDSVEQVIAATVARERPRYERYLSFLGTLGSNAPFVGLFGTVLGIIKAFHDLGRANVKGAAIQQTVMAGISEALVATAVGLAVAIPAVVFYNSFSRQVKTVTARTNAMGHALVARLKAEGAANAPHPLREVK